jgi:serine protease Do
VDENGKVVGVNYATSLVATDQYFAIARDEALSVIDTLRDEENVASIGVNGLALADEEGGALGVFVSSVQPGSPAAETGVAGNDIIVELGGLPVGENNTMQEYCNILRSNPDPEDVIAIEVFRIATGEILEGEIAGNALESTTVLIPDEEVPEDGGEEPPTYEYGSVEDDSGVMTMEVPTEWSDIDGGAWTIDGQEVGAAIRSAPSLDDFFASYDTPGVFFGASASLAQEFDADGLLDLSTTLEPPFADFTTACTYEGRDDYEDPAYTGRFDFYTECGSGGETAIAVVAASPDDGSSIILVMIQAVSDADADAVDHILDTFFVVGALP